MYKEEDLMKAFEKAKRGSKDYYEDFCTMLFDEVRRLVSMVYEKESNINKLVNHIFNKLRPHLGEFDSTKEDIHRWVSVFSSSMIYSVYNMSNSDVFTYKEENSDFGIGYIEEDDEFAECAVYYNRVMSSKRFVKADSAFSMLTKGQIILYQLFCYAGCTVEEIEDMLEVDGVYICSELHDIKAILLSDYRETMLMESGRVDIAKKETTLGKAKVVGVAASTAAESVAKDASITKASSVIEAEDTNSDYDDVAYDDDVQDEYEGDDSYEDDDDDYEYEDMSQDNYDYEESSSGKKSEYADYLNGSRKPRTGSAKGEKNPKKAGGISGLFDGVSDKMMKLIAMCIIALILVVILVMILVFSGKKNDDKSNINNNNNNNNQQTQTTGYEKETESETVSVSDGTETEGQGQSTESQTQSQDETDSVTTGGSVGNTEETKKQPETTKQPESEQKTEGNTEPSTEQPIEAPTETPTEAPAETEKETEAATEPPTEMPTEVSSEESTEMQPDAGAETSAEGV